MGMFDWIDAPPITCECGEKVSGWQSKDGDCLLHLISSDQVNRYYSMCDKCGAWHEFVRPAGPEFEHRVTRNEPQADDPTP